MPREQLQSASEALRDAAAAATGELRDRVYEQSDGMARLAVGETDPDHGQLARYTNTLREIADDAESEGETEAVEHVERAIEHVREYREGVEGV